MLMSLREAYNNFSESHGSMNIGLSKFCELRPKNVKLFDHYFTMFVYVPTMRISAFYLLY